MEPGHGWDVEAVYGKTKGRNEKGRPCRSISKTKEPSPCLTYLDTLAIGKHKVTINFKDGSVDVDITVKEGYVVPKTGDSADLMLWLGLMLMGLLTAGVILVSGKMRNIRK